MSSAAERWQGRAGRVTSQPQRKQAIRPPRGGEKSVKFASGQGRSHLRRAEPRLSGPLREHQLNPQDTLAVP
ncbi:UNVERIFIED_CONTAM: hypothetical protein K2H54_006404 [Gekko kuhli]